MRRMILLPGIAAAVMLWPGTSAHAESSAPAARSSASPQAKPLLPAVEPDGQQPDASPDFALGTPIIRSATGSLLWIDSRIQLDGAAYRSNLNHLASGVMTRRITFALKATFFRDWSAELDVDFAEAKLDLRDVWVMYRPPRIPLAIQVGNFKEPLGLDYITSSRLLTFVERSSVMDAFALGRRLGGVLRGFLPFGQVTFGAFGQRPIERDERIGLDESYSVNARVTAAPLNRPCRVIHLGVAGAYKVPDAPKETALRFRAHPETRVDGAQFLDTGNIQNVSSFWRYGAELAAVWGPVFFQGELLGAVVNRQDELPHPRFWGAYGFLSWVVTGESRVYAVEEGEFGGIERPRHRFGALEVAARLSHLVLNDPGAEIFGGRADQLTLGLNWYPNDSFKLMLDYSFVFQDENATGREELFGGDNFSFLQLRVQAHL